MQTEMKECEEVAVWLKVLKGTHTPLCVPGPVVWTYFSWISSLGDWGKKGRPALIDSNAVWQIQFWLFFCLFGLNFEAVLNRDV